MKPAQKSVVHLSRSVLAERLALVHRSRACLRVAILMVAILMVAILGSLAGHSAEAYSLRRNAAGKALLWREPVVKVGIDTRVVADVPGAADAVRAGFASWSDAGAPVAIRLVANAGGQQRNRVVWIDHDWPFADEVVAMTVSSYQRTDGTVLDAEILLNAVDRTWTTDPDGAPDRFDIENVIAHEAGHFFGLGHSDDPEATMFYATPRGESKKRTLESDDLQGLEAAVAHSAATSAQVNAGSDEPSPSAEAEADEPLTAAGCALVAGRGPEPWAPGALLLAAALLGRRRRDRTGSRRVTRRAVAALLGLGLLITAASEAEATWVRALNVEQLARRANVVLEGRVIAVQPRLLGRWIVTEHTIAVERCLAGRCSAVATLRSIGGELGDRGVFVDGAPRLAVGTRTLLLARRLDDGALRAVGMAQGVFVLRADGRAVRDLRGLQLLGSRPAPQRATTATGLRQRILAGRRHLPQR